MHVISHLIGYLGQPNQLLGKINSNPAEPWLKPTFFKKNIISFPYIFTGLKIFSEIAFAARS